MNTSFWNGKKVLVTGHSGFKGSWITLLLKHLGAEVCGVSSSILNNNQELFLARYKKNLIDFNMKQMTEIPNITGDQDELIRVFQNLIDNAIKYGEENSPVIIEVFMVTHIPDLGGKGLAISIFNKGEDIAPEHIPRLTERFYRIDKSRSRELGGTGLGLAIVKHILVRHRGILKIESKKGYGSTFIVYLPINNSH